MTRTAISPRFAMRTFCSGLLSDTWHSCSLLLGSAAQGIATAVGRRARSHVGVVGLPGGPRDRHPVAAAGNDVSAVRRVAVARRSPGPASVGLPPAPARRTPMRLHRPLVALAALTTLTGLVGAAGPAGAAQADAHRDAGPEGAYSFAVIGDVPYGDAQVAAFPGWIRQINADPAVRSVVHVGDIK